MFPFPDYFVNDHYRVPRGAGRHHTPSGEDADLADGVSQICILTTKNHSEERSDEAPKKRIT
jgi:hypothetical protein